MNRDCTSEKTVTPGVAPALFPNEQGWAHISDKKRPVTVLAQKREKLTDRSKGVENDSREVTTRFTRVHPLTANHRFN